MAKCEFEEKEFEASLYQQLGSVNNHLWAPGQVLEAKLGIDYSIQSVNKFFWSLHGFSQPPQGARLSSIAPMFPSINRPLPNFSLNLFIQAKRPTYRAKASKKLAIHGLGSPHWRFATSPSQQARLASLSAAIGSNGLVCYAAPAFHLAKNLYAHTLTGTVVQNSTFPAASMLNFPHKAWNYSKPGVTGVANTDPKFFDRSPLEVQVSQVFMQGRVNLVRPASESLRLLANQVIESVSGDVSRDDYRRRIFTTRRQQIESLVFRQDLDDFSVVRDFLQVKNYATTFNMCWLTIGESRV